MTDLHCPHCGYNLTGLPENRCPECGHNFDPELLGSGRAYRPFARRQRFIIALQIVAFSVGAAVLLLVITIIDPAGKNNSLNFGSMVVLFGAVFVNSWTISQRLHAVRTRKMNTAGKRTTWVFLVVAMTGLIVLHVLLLSFEGLIVTLGMGIDSI